MLLAQRRVWWLISAAWLAPAVLGALNEVAQGRLHRGGAVDLPSILFGAGDWLIYAAFTPAVLMAAQRWPLSRPRLRLHGGLHLALALLFAAAWAAAGTALKASLVPAQLWGDVRTHFLSWLFITLPFGVAVYLGLVGSEHAIRWFVTAREREVELAQLSQRLAAARLAALEARVNPHFLFNTLNTIGVLVRDGERGAATRVLEHLSDVLRRSLGRHREHEVPLGDELELVRAYAAIEQARFPDRLRVRLDVPPALLGAAVPGFALQHLVENAVRHGIARSPEGGEVTVAARRRGDRLELVVGDDGAGLAGEPDRAGHGLENTRERLRALYGERASLSVEPREPRGVVATLRLPWREMESDAADR
ncbi:MAG TPA: histidine kinase [Thermoanaerobaculia bacterium]